MAQTKLSWQSKLILLAIVPFAGTEVALAIRGTEAASAPVSTACWIFGLSCLLGLLTWRLRAATPAASATGAVITASLLFSTASFPFKPWHTALIPIVLVSLLAYAATIVGRRQKERLGTAEARRGRTASQVAANLGMAAMAASAPVQIWLADSGLVRGTLAPLPIVSLALAAMAEAAADTVSSEIGQVLGGKPRLITTGHVVEPGRNGAVSLAGTAAGMAAAAIVAGSGCWALGGGWSLFAIGTAGGIFGLFFDSLLGATVEDRGWLNNDAVNFLSTASAAGFALLLLALIPHPGVG